LKFFRQSLAGAAVLAAIGLLTPHSAPAGAQDKTVRIGFQKYGYKVTWTEFPAGPQLLEAVNVGAIDFGNTGEAPPIFAQAAGAPLLYVAYEPPAPKGEAILVPKDSPIKSVIELKGKKVALNKGSNVHYLLVKTLEKAGVNYSDIELVFLAPADARAAFEKGAVDAWAIWDPFQAAAEQATGARTLANGEDTVANHQFYLAAKSFATANPKVLEALLTELSEVDKWVQSDIKAASAQLAASVGLPVPVVELALQRQSYGIVPINDKVIAAQQDIADTFVALGVLPKKINVSEAVWKAGS
jgi:sulfonate transport system substrate-binding protein